MLKKLLILEIFAFIIQINYSRAQSPWPSETWADADNLTSVMDAGGLTGLSGIHWNPDLKRLYLVHDNGNFRVLEFNTLSNIFTQIAKLPISGDTEDITQVDYNVNEFFTIDENNYEIRKYSYSTNFSSLTKLKSWNLLLAPSPMTDTGNSGPEGIAFVPDQFLIAAGFISQSTGQLYTSVKGMGGLMFVAQQEQGAIWVFDVNPDKIDDFAYVGKYQTNRNESCDLEFDRSTGLLYILHNTWKSNPDNNYLEVSDLKSTVVNVNERKLIAVNEYTIANPSKNANIEGFAITPNCADENNVSVWLCRDVESTDPVDEQTDCLRRYHPFVADGVCNTNSLFPVSGKSNYRIKLFPNPSKENLKISVEGNFLNKASLRIIDLKGQLRFEKTNLCGENFEMDISSLEKGIYLIEFIQDQKISTLRWMKE